MGTQQVPTGFIKARISTGDRTDIAGAAKLLVRNMKVNQSFEQAVNPNTEYVLPVSPGNYAVFGSLGSVRSSGVQIEVKDGETTEEINFVFSK